MNPKGAKLLALALDPAAAIGEMQAAAIKFIELCRREGYRASGIHINGAGGNGHGPSAGWVGEKFNLLREVSHWKARAEAAEAAVGKHVMRVKFLEERGDLLTREADRLKLAAPSSIRQAQHGMGLIRAGKHTGRKINSVSTEYLRRCLASRTWMTSSERDEMRAVLKERAEHPELEV